MENKEPNNQEDSDKKRIIFFLLIAGSVLLGIFVFPNICDQYDSKPVVVYTLSKEQLEGYGYTTKESLNIDIWESEVSEASEYLGSTVFATTETADDEVLDSFTSESTRVTVTFPLDINSASVDELIMVRGIGEITANKIVEYRGINGYFYSMDELLNVNGIGEKKLAALTGYLYIDYDSLPETLPYIQDYLYDTEIEPIAVTTVPTNDTEIMETVVSSVVTTDDFVINTENFITDLDEEEFETETPDTWYLYSEDPYLFEITESEYYPNFPIELNSADIKDLIYIKGIGESTANKIVEYARNVGFTTVEDLLNVSGIGQSKLETIRPYVYVVSSGITYVPELSNTDTLMQSETSCEIYRVNINTCGKNDLLQLPGIDEDLANDILELRNDIGYFKNIEELSFVLSNEKLSVIWNYVFV